ncbi:MAG: hypothetical protein SH807_10245 [Blastochloris sp.]|jgi:hypothetical protein|nr:hypothetical protein [Blastochloris sp.]
MKKIILSLVLVATVSAFSLSTAFAEGSCGGCKGEKKDKTEKTEKDAPKKS